MIDRFINLVSNLGHWGYLVIFLAALLESSAFLGLIIPGETLVILGGFLASRGILDLGDLMILVAVGAIVGDSIGYELGRRLGRKWLLHYGRWAGLKVKHLQRVDQFFDRHGSKTVLIGRFIGFLRALAPFAAGSSRMHYLRFLFYNAVGAILWSVGFVLVGYFVGESWRLVEHWIGRASAALGILLALILVFSWLWGWLVRHEAVVREHWDAFLRWPRVAAFQRRFAPHIAFLQDRLTPSGYLGLSLTVGIVIIVTAAWLFGGITEDVVHSDPLTVVDQSVKKWMEDHAAVPITDGFIAITYLGSPVTISALTVLTALILTIRRNWFDLLRLALVVPGGAILLTLLKIAIHRPRPTTENPIVVLSSYSYPSGHVGASVLLFGLLATLGVKHAHGWRYRVTFVLVAIMLVLIIALSRVYLRVHYLSDVLGAMAFGVAWLTICLTAVRTLQRSRTSLFTEQ